MRARVRQLSQAAHGRYEGRHAGRALADQRRPAHARHAQAQTRVEEMQLLHGVLLKRMRGVQHAAAHQSARAGGETDSAAGHLVFHRAAFDIEQLERGMPVPGHDIAVQEGARVQIGKFDRKAGQTLLAAVFIKRQGENILHGGVLLRQCELSGLNG